MNEKKKAIIVLGCAIAFLVLIGLMYYVGVQKGKDLMKDFDSAYNGSEAKIIYVGRPTCGYCNQLKPILDEMTEQYELEYVYVNTDDISDDQLSYVINTLEFDEEKFGTPSLAIVKDGKKIAEQLGATDEEGLLEFLKDGGLVDESAKLEDDTPNLTKIDYDGYEKLLNSDEKFVVVLGQTGCGACNSAKPVLDAVAEKHSIEINWLNLTNMSSDDGASLMSSLEYFEDSSISTPTVLIIQDKEVVDSLESATDEEGYIDFFKENKLIK